MAENLSPTRIHKTVDAGYAQDGHAFVYINFDGRKLSITGVIGPKENGDCLGSCGQCQDSIVPTADGTLPDFVPELLAVWDRWHLNDMRAGCEHQRAEWDPSEPLEIISYRLTTEAYRERNSAISRAAELTAQHKPSDLTTKEEALILRSDWFKDRHSIDPSDPLAGCYEEKKRETKAAGWVTPAEHPGGLLTKPCPTCGYKYGSSWLFEPVPESVLDFLRSIPECDAPAGWPNR